MIEFIVNIIIFVMSLALLGLILYGWNKEFKDVRDETKEKKKF